MVFFHDAVEFDQFWATRRNQNRARKSSEHVRNAGCVGE